MAVIILVNLSDIFKDLPIINFESKKQYLIAELSQRYPDKIEMHKMVDNFQKSNTIVHPYDFPLSDDFIDAINTASDEESVELLIKMRLEEQHKVLKEDYTSRYNMVIRQYEVFIHHWHIFEQYLVKNSKQMNVDIEIGEVVRLIDELQNEIKRIELEKGTE